MEEKSSLRGRLPDDIEADILLRLPVKSLKRFECACKSWSSLISSPQFQLDHFRRAQQNPRIITLQSNATLFDENRVDDLLTLRFSVYNKYGSLVNKFSKPDPNPHFLSTVLGKPFMLSCQGLVCVVSYAGPILVCNPSTEEMISLPSVNGASRCFGIGYSSSTKEFKVVSISYDGSCCKVFTLGTRCWRKARTPPYHVNQGTAPFLNGAFHFLRKVGFWGVKDTDYISAFDIETEDYKGIPLPEFYYGLRVFNGCRIAHLSNFLRLTKLGGKLCLTFDFGELDDRLEVWVLKDYHNGEWVKGYDINVSSVYPHPSYCFRAFPSDNMGTESILLSCDDQLGVRVLCYNTEDGIVTLFKDKEWGGTFYVESFYRLKDGSLSSEISVLGSKTEAREGRISVAVGGARKYGYVPKNKYDVDSEDGEDGDGEDGDDQDQDCDDRAADGSGDIEILKEGDGMGDNSPSSNGEDGSDYEDDGDEEDEEDEEIPCPPIKKRKWGV